MARSPIAVESAVLEDMLQEDEDTKLVMDGEEEQSAPPYVLIGDASMPVSKKAGKRWKQKIDDALAVYEPEFKRWDRIFTMYASTTDERSTVGDDAQLNAIQDVDENLIRENVKLLLRSTYTRNPKIELSSVDNEQKPTAKVYELALQSLMNRKTAPGINAKSRIRRQIVHAHLTNYGVLKLDYQARLGSRQEALQELDNLRRVASEEDDLPKLEEIYAKLEQVEDFLPLSKDSGMSLKNTLPMNVIVDPECSMYDLSDAKWLAEIIMLDDEYIRDRYYEKNEDGAWVRKSDGKVVKMKENNRAGADEVKETVVNQVTGFTTKERLDYLEKGKTRCYLVWDKLTRNILLFSENDWDYPLWVYEDDLKLSRFFQHFIVGYTEPVDGIVQAGEPSQYMGQIREVNKINRKLSYIRRVAFGALIYNSKAVKGDTAERLIRHLENPEEVKAFGLDFDTELDLEKVLKSFVPPVAQYRELFDTSQLKGTINRASSANDAMRGEQFKTNTTNQAIATYNQAANIVTNELTDVVEDAVEELAWAMCEVLVSKYSKEDVAKLIGQKNAEGFEAMSVDEFNARFSLVVAAGSTEKPTSETKKREALEIAQALGQIGQSAPMTTMKLMSRMFSEAFSEFLVTDDDWTEFAEEFKMTMSRGQSAPVQGQGQPQPPAGGQPQ